MIKSRRIRWARHVARRGDERKQRTDVGKYSFVKRTRKDWNNLPAGILASFPCKLKHF
jgi:hypothetical protein